MSILKSGVAWILVGVLIGSTVVWNIQGTRIDILKAESNILKANINAEIQHSKKLLKIKEKKFNEILAKSDSKYKEQESAYIATLNRLQHDRNSYRAQLMSRIAESSRVSNELCFSREGFESAIQRLDESLSGIIEQCLNTETRLTITRDWYNTIKNVE